LGGASYFLNKVVSKTETSESSNPTETKINSQTYSDAARQYLTDFSEQTFALLKDYQNKAEQIICFQPSNHKSETLAAEYQLQLLTNLLEKLQSATY
jgi:hypothetical protein